MEARLAVDVALVSTVSLLAPKQTILANFISVVSLLVTITSNFTFLVRSLNLFSSDLLIAGSVYFSLAARQLAN